MLAPSWKMADYYVHVCVFSFIIWFPIACKSQIKKQKNKDDGNVCYLKWFIRKIWIIQFMYIQMKM